MWGLTKITDLKPLSSLTNLEFLSVSYVPAEDLKPLSTLTKLKELNIEAVPAKDLTPLSALLDLEELECGNIPLTTSVLPLEKCNKLKNLWFDEDAKDLSLLKEKRPDMFVNDDDHHGEVENDDDHHGEEENE